MTKSEAAQQLNHLHCCWRCGQKFLSRYKRRGYGMCFLCYCATRHHREHRKARPLSGFEFAGLEVDRIHTSLLGPAGWGSSLSDEMVARHIAIMTY